MRHIFVLAIIFSLFSIPLFSEKVRHLNLDDASSIGLRIQADRDEKTEGRASLRITTRWPTTVCLGEVTGLEMDPVKLLYRAMAKSALKGTAFLEMWVHFKDGRYFSRGLNKPVKNRSDWTSLETPFVLKKGQVPEKITLNVVINGTGTVWVDDVVLSVE